VAPGIDRACDSPFVLSSARRGGRSRAPPARPEGAHVDLDKHGYHRARRTSVFVTHSADEAVFLGSRIVVLTARPGRIALDLTIDLPRSGVDPDELRGSAECRTQLRTLAAAQSRRRVSSSSPSRATSRR
jgi:hypothetical protein